MSGKFQSILLGALLTGILAAAYYVVQFGNQSQILGALSCCVVPTVGALVAVWHYTTTNALTLASGQGATIGMSAGALGYVISWVLALLISLTGIVPGPFDMEAIVEVTRDAMVEQGQDPAIIDQSIEMVRQFFWLGPVIGVAAYSAFGAVVGAIAANVFKKGDE